MTIPTVDWSLPSTEDRYRLLMDHASEAVSILSATGLILEVNRRWEELLMLPRERILGRHVREFAAPERAPDDLAAYDLRPGSGKEPSTVLRIARADGAILLIDFSSTAIDTGDQRVILSIGRDVTEQARVQAQLMVSDRMASVGAMAAGVAHEINNPLAAAMMNIELAVRTLDQLARDGVAIPAELRDELTDAIEATHQVREIVRDLKVFSRPDEMQRGPVDLHRVLDSSLRMAWNEIRHRARLVKDYGDVPCVIGNESRLGQVFLNLIVNAAQAIDEGHADDNEIRVATHRDADGRVVVTVRDTGSGMPWHVQRRLFTPFLTTKPVGVGTGLGLSICHRIVTALGGGISFDSEEGKGTTFRVTLPATACAPPAVAEVPAAIASPPARRVLIVDDEPLVAGALRRCLGGAHEVTVTTSAEDALDRIGGGARFDLILCDLMMPQMTGMELHDRLHALVPEQAARMVFVTGGAFTKSAQDFLETVAGRYLEKPFRPDAVEAVVRAASTW
jgi:PAS domain S-box-containing protein